MGNPRAGAVAGALVMALLGCGGAGQVNILDSDASDGSSAPNDGASRDGSHRDAGRDRTAEDAPPDARKDSASRDTGPPCSALCVPSVPPGWQGPEELYEGASSPPPCGSSFATPPAYDGNANPMGGDAMCGMCTCDHPTGVTCSPSVSVSFFQDSACTKPCGSGPVSLPNGMCTSIMGDLASCAWTPTGGYLSTTGVKVTGGSCAPSTETATLPPVTWSESGQSCAPAAKPSASGCPGDDLCAPATDPGYATYCVHKKGDQMCPSAGYTTKHVLYGGFTDTRACSDCTCGDVSPTACDESSVAAFAGACSIFASAGYTPLPVSCAPLAATTQNLSYVGVAVGGSCNPSGGTPKGGVTPAMAETFCCTP